MYERIESTSRGAGDTLIRCPRRAQCEMGGRRPLIVTGSDTLPVISSREEHA